MGGGHLLSSISVLKMQWLKNLKLEGLVILKNIRITPGELVRFFPNILLEWQGAMNIML